MRFRAGLAVLAVSVGAWASAGLTYHVTDLGTLGGIASYGYGVNESGQVVGESYVSVDGFYHAFLYSDGIMKDLGTLGGEFSSASDVNDAGQVVGWAEGPPFGHPIHAFLFSSGVMTDLGTLGGDRSKASAINASGQIVGEADTTWNRQTDAFLYSNGLWTDLGAMGGDMCGATAINDSCKVVGYYLAEEYGGLRAFLYSGGVMTGIGTLGGVNSYAYGINAAGDVIGASDTGSPASQIHAFLYSGDVMRDLGTMGGTQSWALSINASGVVAGYANVGGEFRAFLFSQGEMKDLNGFLDAGSSGYVVSVATCIAVNGMIAATGHTPGGETHALLLTPNAGPTGTVSLRDFVGSYPQVPVTIEIRDPGTTTVVQKQTVKLDADGTFQFCTTLAGSYDVVAKASHWLRKKVSNVTMSGSEFESGVNFSLVNGDVNGDNAVNLGDLVAVLSAWRTKPGDARWIPSADLNGDGSVTLSDFVIVSKNWRKSGDG